MRISRDISRITRSSIIEKIKIDRKKNKEVVKVVKIKKAEVKVLRENKWQINRDLVLREEKFYMLKNEDLRIEIIQLYHNCQVAESGLCFFLFSCSFLFSFRFIFHFSFFYF